jgi:hypothetical protein
MTIEIPIISTYKDKGAKAAETSLSKLTGTAKRLGLALGLALSVNRIVAFGKASVAEFAASEKAAASLQNTLRNTGNLLAFPDAQAGIKNLAMLSGVADDSLIPLFSQLYLATGNVNQAMTDLNTAIDVSRGSSNELGSVVDALTKGYAGNTKGLAGLNVGLSRAYLASADMTKITKELNNTFGGASAAFLETYAGKVALINNQWSESKEIVGQGLVMAFETATGNRGAMGMTNAMENLGFAISATAIRVGQLIKLMGTDIPLVSDVLKRVVDGWSYILGVEDTRVDIQNELLRTNTRLNYEAMLAAEAQAKRNKEYLAFLARQKKLTEASAAAAKKRAAEEKKLAAERKLLEQAGSIFDIEQIQIYAALQNKVTDQEKLRLSLQMALLQENVSEAQRLATELFKSQLQTTNLADAIAKLPRALYPFSGWSEDIDLLLKQIELLKKLLASMSLPSGVSTAGVIGAMGGYDAAGRYVGTPFGQAGSNVSTYIGSQGGYDMSLNYVGTPFGQAQPSSTTNIYVNGATQQLLNELRTGLIDSSASGSFSTINPFR